MPQYRPVVPLVCLHDGTDFASVVSQRLQGLFRTPFDKVLVQGPLEQNQKVVSSIFEAGFRQRLMPLTLWEHQPFWVVWLLGRKESIEHLVGSVPALDKAHPGELHHIVILKMERDFNVESHFGSLVNWLCGSLVNRLCCVLANEGMINRTDLHLALAIAAWLFAGWERFCSAGSGSFADALWLPNDSRVVTLGCSIGQVDKRYHASRWAYKVAETVRQKWTEQIGDEPPPQFPNLRELLALLLPYLERWLTSKQAAHGANVQMQDEFASVLTRELAAEFKHKKGYSTSDYLSQLRTLRSKFYSLTFLELEPTREVIQGQRAVLWKSILEHVQNTLQLPEQPDSALYRIRQRLGFAKLFAQRLEAARGSGDRGGSFQAEFDKAQRLISALPSPLGLALRLSLVLLVLAWLVIGQTLWLGAVDFRNDPVLRGSIAYSVITGGILLTGTVAHFFRRHREVWRHLDRMEANLWYRHHAEISRMLAAAIKSQGEALTKQVVAWENQAQDLTNSLVNPLASVADSASNEYPIVNDASVDRLLEPKLAEMSLATHLEVCRKLNTGADPNFQPSDWLAALQDASNLIVNTHVSSLGFEACLEARNLFPCDRQTLFANLVQEARAPAWKRVSAVQQTTICFGNESWKACCGSHDTVVFHPLRYPELIIISVAPVQIGN